MATNTSYFDLSKPAYSDTADIATINGNMDKVDASLNGLGKGLAVIAKNNTHDAITNGQFVYVHGHGSLAEGIYRATSNISANAALSNSNLTAVPGGLGARLASLADSIAYDSGDIKSYFTKAQADSTVDTAYMSRSGNVVTVTFAIGTFPRSNSGTVVGTLSRYRPTASTVNVTGYIGAGTAEGSPARITMVNDENGTITAYSNGTGTGTLRFTATYVTNNV